MYKQYRLVIKVSLSSLFYLYKHKSDKVKETIEENIYKKKPLVD